MISLKASKYLAAVSVLALLPFTGAHATDSAQPEAAAENAVEQTEQATEELLNTGAVEEMEEVEEADEADAADEGEEPAQAD